MLGRDATVPFVDNFTMLGDLDKALGNTSGSRKRERVVDDDLDLEGFFFFEDEMDTKKFKFEDAAMDLMGVHVEDNASTSKFMTECPDLMGENVAFSLDDEVDFVALLLDEEDDPNSFSLKTKTPAAAIVPHNVPGYDSRIPLPSKKWFAALNMRPPSPLPPLLARRSKQLPIQLPIVAVKSVCVEERSLSTDQKAKHAQWSNKRQRCLTGHKGYKCPAKSRAAKNKVRSNGRFELKK